VVIAWSGLPCSLLRPRGGGAKETHLVIAPLPAPNGIADELGSTIKALPWEQCHGPLEPPQHTGAETGPSPASVCCGIRAGLEVKGEGGEDDLFGRTGLRVHSPTATKFSVVRQIEFFARA
jgi:hypothetical protein